MSDTSIYEIGSITKSFTAVLIMKLLEEGHFDLNNKFQNTSPMFHMVTLLRSKKCYIIPVDYAIIRKELALCLKRIKKETKKIHMPILHFTSKH